jgi:hypothetical protein
VLPPNDTGTDVVADYGVGVAGVLAFWLRLRHGGARMWLPEVLTVEQPADRTDRLDARSSPRERR